ncbi:hypothetical protein EV715DRAFT_289437 [Schizophyllum commune]
MTRADPGAEILAMAMRRFGQAFPPEEKERIAQFFYSFGRHFETLPGESIEHTAREEYRNFQNSRADKQAAVTSGLPLYSHDGREYAYFTAC